MKLTCLCNCKENIHNISLFSEGKCRKLSQKRRPNETEREEMTSGYQPNNQED